VGDKLLTIDNKEITPNKSVEQVRNLLRGEPGTDVTIQFQREGVTEVQTVTMPRTVVQIRDVKLATLMGKPQDGIGYIQVTGFATNTGQEVRQAIMGLQRATEVASNGERSLQGLILDLRGNPGGLLTSAVDVASLLVPKGSDIVSAKGRGFPGVLYRSRVDPILEPNTKLAVLVNGGTASAAEIVSGAVQDLDVGVIVGSDRTYGKGLVQNVEEMPFNTALKFTVAKYYTPSGRCIQGIKYSEGGLENGGRYKERKVAAKDRATFHTRLGREVKDGGGIEADYKVPAAKASALEVTLLRSGAMGEFAALWSKSHELTNNFKVDDKTYNEFQAFVNQKHKEGDIKLDALYKGPIRDLKEVLKQSGFKASSKELDQLQASIIREVQKDFEKYKTDLKEDLEQSILARYLPESMLIEQSLKTDKQVAAAVKLVSNGRQFDSLLAKGNAQQLDGVVGTLNTAVKQEDAGVRLNMKW
jgi:carboxyl-terminal processing protease